MSAVMIVMQNSFTKLKLLLLAVFELQSEHWTDRQTDRQTIKVQCITPSAITYRITYRIGPPHETGSARRVMQT